MVNWDLSFWASPGAKPSWALIRFAAGLVVLAPIVVYLDAVVFHGPLLSLVAVLMFALLLIWDWMRRGTKRAFAKQTLILSMVFLTICPVLTLFFSSQQEQRIAEQVKQVGEHITDYKSSKGQYPRNLKDVDTLAARHVFISDQSMKIGGRVVTYFRSQNVTTPAQSEDFAKLSYWSFGAYQRQFFDIGSGTFDSPLID
jgi:predicted PurR-regulated permease PerM